MHDPQRGQRSQGSQWSFQYADRLTTFLAAVRHKVGGWHPGADDPTRMISVGRESGSARISHMSLRICDEPSHRIRVDATVRRQLGSFGIENSDPAKNEPFEKLYRSHPIARCRDLKSYGMANNGLQTGPSRHPAALSLDGPRSIEPSHGENRGSSPLGSANTINNLD
jgi:hypothetical protein